MPSTAETNWSVKDLTMDGLKVTAAYAAVEPRSNCQRSLGVVKAFVIDVGVCTEDPTGAADRIAFNLIAKIP